jgi:hypothetical protein
MKSLTTPIATLRNLNKLKQTSVKQMKMLDADIQAAQAEMAKPLPQTEDPSMIEAEQVSTSTHLRVDIVIDNILHCRLKRRVRNSASSKGAEIWRESTGLTPINMLKLARTWKMQTESTSIVSRYPIVSRIVRPPFTKFLVF